VSDDTHSESGWTLNLRALAGLQVGVESIAAELAAERRRRDARIAALPVDSTAQATAITDAAGVATMDLAGPAQGRYWLVRRIVVTGATASTAVSGTLYVYTSAAAPEILASLPPDGLLDIASVLPAVAYYSGHQAIVRSRERLIAVLTGSTAATQVTVQAQVEDVAVSSRQVETTSV
jgi:hypothetical protein